MIEGATKEETIRLTAEHLGISEVDAAFIYAQEREGLRGDVLTEGVDDASPDDQADED